VTEHFLQVILLGENCKEYPTLDSLKRDETVAPKQSNP